MSHENAISFENVSFSYEDESIISNASFTIAQGECVGVIGPNGGGKTTLLKLILSLLKPKAGKIRLFGKSSQEALPLIGWVPQNLHFDRSFPILVHEVVLASRLAHLNIWGRFRKTDILIARESLSEVGLLDLWDRPISSLSGGQCQRVLIARALAARPKLLLLDEPTANVDAKAEKEIFSLLAVLKKRMTILIVTHDLNATLDLVDRIIVVQKKVSVMSLSEVCEHFAMGLYHTPLVEGGHRFQQEPIPFRKREDS